MPDNTASQTMPETALVDYTPTGSFVAERDTPPPVAEAEETAEAEAPAVEEAKEDPADEYRKRISGIAKKDREVARRLKEVELREQQFMDVYNREMQNFATLKAAKDAASRGDNIELLRNLGADPTSLYSEMTNLAIEGKLDVSKLSAPKQDEVYKQIAEELAATKAEIQELKEERTSRAEREVISNARNYLEANKSKYPVLAKQDDGTVLWRAVQAAYAEDPTVTVDQVAQEIESRIGNQLKSHAELWREINNASVESEDRDESVVSKPKQIAKTISNKANNPQMPKNIHDRLKGITDMQERARILRKYYMDNDEY